MSARDVAREAFNASVRDETRKLRIREAAQRAVHRQGTPPIPKPVRLTELLAVPDEPTIYRIDELWPVGARVVLAAQFKSGKTTLRDNLVRSLADGDPFLGAFKVTVPDRTIAVIDNEMDERTTRRWFRDQGVINTDQVHVVSLRDQAASFDILDPHVRAQWAAMLRGVDPGVVILDCLRTILDALGLDESRDAGRVLVAIGALIGECGADEGTVVHHMGHTGERSRGDSRLRDWPDVEWRLVRADDDPASARYFSAYGRDVDVREGELGYNSMTRRLTLIGGSRRDATVAAVVSDVVSVVGTADHPLSGREIEEALKGRRVQHLVRAAVKAAVDDGKLGTQPGPHNARLHHLTQSSASVRQQRVNARE